MSTLENKKDEVIKRRFAEDKIMVSRENVEASIKNDIDKSRIRLKKHTYLERYLMVLLVILLAISLVCNVYLIKSRNENNQFFAQEETDIQSFDDIDIEEENKPIQNTTVVNLDTYDPFEVISNDDEEEEDKDKEEEKTTPIKEVEQTPTTHEVDEAGIKKMLTTYAITIGRNGSDASDLEKNTILLLIANDFFNSSVSKSTGLEISSNGKYAMTSKNVHKFIEELVGIKVNDYLPSYSNYMKYNNNSKFYSAGSDSTKLKEEKYEITSMNVTAGDKKDEYKVIGNIKKNSQVEIQERTKTRIEDIEANYSFEATLEENTNYTYVQYQIKDFVTELRAGDEDNIIRLVGIAEQEDANAKKK